MGIAADIAEDWHAALAALAWEVEAGADETMLDAPVNRYDLRAEAPKPLATSAAPDPGRTDPVATARAMAEQAQTLDALREAITGFDLCDLKKGARNTVFADGNPKARVLILGEAPGAEEDREGRPFVGRAGQLAGPDVRRHRPVTHQPRCRTCALHHQRHALAPPGEPRPGPGRDRDDAALRRASHRTGRPAGDRGCRQHLPFRPDRRQGHPSGARATGPRPSANRCCR
jgi:hypothetical protein